jgi:ABC-2 type transport system permease protein
MARSLTARIIRHELRVLARGPVAAVALVLLCVTVAYAAWSGTRWRQEQLATIGHLREHDARVSDRIASQLDELERRGDPRPNLQLAGMAWYIFQPNGAEAPAPHIDPRRPEAASSEWVGARHVHLPPAPFSALAVGQSDLHPYYTRVTIRTPSILIQRDELENPLNLLNGRFDLAFVLAVCWPILVLPLLYNLIAEDRESGTLALLASQPVSLRRILSIRLAIRAGVALIVTLLTSVGALAVFGGLADVSPVDMLPWSAAAGGSALFWCGLAAVVNLTRWRAALNAAVLTVAWVGLVIVAPALLGELAASWAPVPSRVQLTNTVREAGNLSGSDMAALVTAYYEAHPDASPSKDSADVTAIRGLAQQDEVDRRIEPVLAAYQTATARQQRLAERLRFISPPLLIYDAVAELAGTTASRYRSFVDQVDRYHTAWRGYFYPLVHARVSLTMAHYERAPQFAFEDERAGAARARAMRLVGVAGAIGLLLTAIALWRARATQVMTERS